MDTIKTQEEVLTVGDWMITLLIAAIPVIGFVMLFVWGFGSSSGAVKSNWAKAMLAWMAILAVIYTLFFMVLGVAMFSS